MAESIITLGIGATPVSLTPFITTGLFIDTYVPQTESATIKTSDGTTSIVSRDAARTIKSSDKSIEVKV